MGLVPIGSRERIICSSDVKRSQWSGSCHGRTTWKWCCQASSPRKPRLCASCEAIERAWHRSVIDRTWLVWTRSDSGATCGSCGGGTITIDGGGVVCGCLVEDCPDEVGWTPSKLLRGRFLHTPVSREHFRHHSKTTSSHVHHSRCRSGTCTGRERLDLNGLACPRCVRCRIHLAIKGE